MTKIILRELFERFEIMFRINFNTVFAKEDSDHLKGIGIYGNKLYITFHKRMKVVSYYEGDLHIEKAHDTTYSYTFDNEEELKKTYEELVRK